MEKLLRVKGNLINLFQILYQNEDKITQMAKASVQDLIGTRLLKGF